MYDVPDDHYNDWGDEDDDKPAINYNKPLCDVSDEADKGVASDTTEIYLDEVESTNSEATIEYNVETDSITSHLILSPSDRPTAKPLSPIDLESNSLGSVSDNYETQSSSCSNHCVLPVQPCKSKKKSESKEEKEKMKYERAKIREERKEKLLREKELKAAIASQQRNLKPEEAIKHLIVHIDTQIINSSAGAHIIPVLQKGNIKYFVESLNHSNTIIWTKESCTQLDSGKEKTEDDQILEIVGWWDLVAWISKGELLHHVESIQRRGKKLTLIIVGMEKYLNHQANKINKTMKTSLTGTQQRGRKVDADLANAPDVAANEIEMALTEIQLLANCCHRNAETGEEVAAAVFQMTRSISQVDYKREQYSREKDTLSWFAKADGKGCVRVDKTGNGLLELWQQQICQFNNVGLEVAQAIVGQYGSPQALLAAYTRCSDADAAEKLLENIAVRRDAGILSSSRRVGPELSKKVHRFFSAKDAKTVI